MGDVVFAPFYEVLVRRGVKFHFFHRLTNVKLCASGGFSRPRNDTSKVWNSMSKRIFLVGSVSAVDRRAWSSMLAIQA